MAEFCTLITKKTSPNQPIVKTFPKSTWCEDFGNALTFGQNGSFGCVLSAQKSVHNFAQIEYLAFSIFVDRGFCLGMWYLPGKLSPLDISKITLSHNSVKNWTHETFQVAELLEMTKSYPKMQQKESYLKQFLKRVVWRTSQSFLGNSSVKCIRKKHVWLALTA